MTFFRTGISILVLALALQFNALAQPCTTLGQNPSTAFPVCGTTVFQQTNVPICATTDLFVPGCGPNAIPYQNKNPFWYKFHCFQTGTLGFTITPNDLTEDYDWQLYDVTGLNPDEVYTNVNIIVTGNWSGSSGLTGASANGAGTIQCASVPTDNEPTFTMWPVITVGHDYILLVSHFSDSQSGYSLSFSGGSAVITDPTEPHLLKAIPGCDGKTITLKLNKNMRCSSLTSAGTEFSISPAVTTVVSAGNDSCTTGFDLSQLTITLASPLPEGDYQLIINSGADGNTLLDNCDRQVPAAEAVTFHYAAPQPTPIDSIGFVGCAPNSIRLYFSKRIQCSSIAANGSDFSITGPTPVTISGAAGNCANGLSDVITVNFSSPIYSGGNYQLTLQPGSDVNTVIDECGIATLAQSLSFVTADTVSAAFNYTNKMSCTSDTLIFSHDAAHNVNTWKWTINGNVSGSTPSIGAIFPSASINSVGLVVSNGTCSDSSFQTITLDNETKALFNMPDVICPEDPLVVKDSSKGQIDSWLWKFDIQPFNVQNPPPYYFQLNNQQAYHTIQLIVSNTALQCKDSVSKRLLVLNNCFIAVPTAFTPNGDGLNDYLSPHNAIKAENLEFKVFNRWGQLVFASNNWLQKWDGTVNGLPQASGIYVWFLRYKHRDTGQMIFQKGTTMLIR